LHVAGNRGLKEAYQSSWINVQRNVATYEKYKFEEKGFTKNPKEKAGHTLDASGKKKLAVINAIMGRDKNAKKDVAIAM
jgi:hypothetical protein